MSVANTLDAGLSTPSMSSVLVLSLELSYVILALCVAPIACLLCCCCLLMLAVRAAAKKQLHKAQLWANQGIVNNNTRVGCCSSGMDRTGEGELYNSTIYLTTRNLQSCRLWVGLFMPAPQSQCVAEVGRKVNN